MGKNFTEFSPQGLFLAINWCKFFNVKFDSCPECCTMGQLQEETKMAQMVRASRFAVVAALAGGLVGCATVQYNDGKTVVIQHQGQSTMSSAQETADATCRAGGKKAAVHVQTVPNSTAVPSVIAAAISTFRCE